jgi:hypothetical protein
MGKAAGEVEYRGRVDTGARRAIRRGGSITRTSGRGMTQDETTQDKGSDAKAERILHRRLDRIEQRLPDFLAAWIAHLRQPSASWVRVPLGLLLIVAGMLGFLPVLGFWMVPLGLVLLALDIALLRRPMAQMIVSGERWWATLRRRRGGG